MIYKPRARRHGLNIPFGYYVNPLDPLVWLPNAKELDSLHYAFRMKARYGTSLNDCAMWLHSATGRRMSAAGFKYAYDRWLKNIKRERGKELASRKEAIIKAQQKYIDENFKEFQVVLDADKDLTSVAQKQAKEAWKKKSA